MAEDRMAVLETVRETIAEGDVDFLRESVRVLFGRCDRLGRVDLHDLGEHRRVRQRVIEVIIPGQAGESRLPDEAHFWYREWWRRSSVGWVRFRYHYDYFDLRYGGRRGYHLHPLAGRGPVPHAVCVLPDGTGRGRHYAAHEVELLTAHGNSRPSSRPAGLLIAAA